MSKKNVGKATIVGFTLRTGGEIFKGSHAILIKRKGSDQIEETYPSYVQLANGNWL